MQKIFFVCSKLIFQLFYDIHKPSNYICKLYYFIPICHMIRMITFSRLVSEIQNVGRQLGFAES